MNNKCGPIKAWPMLFAAVFAFSACIFLASCAPEPQEPIPEDPSVSQTELPVLPEQPEAPIGESGLRLISTGGEYSQEETEYITAFYTDCVFIGDSLTVQLQGQIKKNEDPVFAKTRFLCNTGFSARTSHMDPNDENAVHPMFGGKKQYVWNSAAIMGAKKAFISFWSNEFVSPNAEDAAENFYLLAQKMREFSPEIELYFVSPCFIHNSYQSEYLNNSNISELQQLLKAFCEENGYHYVEISKYFGDEENGFYPEYCSDNAVHMTYDALDIWLRILKDYAIGIETPLEDFPRPQETR